MTYGLTEAEFTFLQERLIQPLKKHGAQVYLFGSRATGKHKKFSDIDILFKESTHSIANSEIYRLLSEIEDSNFPYKIDLVAEKDLAQSYRTNIDREKIAL